MTWVPFFRVARCRVGNLRSGKEVVTGTPALRSTVDASVLYFGSTAGTLNGAGVTAGSSASTSRLPGETTRVWLPLPAPSQVLPVPRTEATVASPRVFRLSRKQPGSPV